MDLVLEAAKSQGLWALLFVSLFVYVIKENGKREAKYQEIIANLTEKFEGIEEGLKSLNTKFEGWIKK
jgi:hypothetical protein